MSLVGLGDALLHDLAQVRVLHGCCHPLLVVDLLVDCKTPARGSGGSAGKGISRGIAGKWGMRQRQAQSPQSDHGNHNSCHYSCSGKGWEVFQWGVPKPRVKFRVKEWPRFSVQLFQHNIPFLAGTEGSGHCWDRAWLWLGRTPRSCQLSCQTCLRNLQIWCGELRTVGPTAEAAPRVSYPTFVTNTCQNWGVCYKSKAAASSVTEPPQPWGHLGATGFAGSDRGAVSGEAGEQRTGTRG